MSGNPYQTSAKQLAVTIGFKNLALIAALVLPEIPVTKKDFKYNVFDEAEGFSVPDTKAGRKSELNQVSFGSKQVNAGAVDYGLTDVIPNDDISDNAAAGLPNPVLRSTEKLTGLIHLDREVRTAAIVFKAANYTHKVNLASADRFDKEDVDALKVILGYLDAPLMRPNVMVIGQAAWTKLRTNPSIVKAVHGNSGDSGAVSKKALADLLEIEEILVGQAFVNIAKKGRAANNVRAWGKHIAFIYRNSLAMDVDDVMTWGFTSRFGGWVSGQRDEPKIGLRGSKGVKVGETRGEHICAKGAGFFIENAVS